MEWLLVICSRLRRVTRYYVIKSTKFNRRSCGPTGPKPSLSPRAASFLVATMIQASALNLHISDSCRNSCPKQSITESAPSRVGVDRYDNKLTCGIPTFAFGSPTTCTYCGDDRHAKDHVIPWSFQTISDKRIASGPMTFACRSCNLHLTNHYFGSFWERCTHAHSKIGESMHAEWAEYEIKKLDYINQCVVRNNMVENARNKIRAEWFMSRDFFLNIENLTHFENLYSSNEFLRDYFTGTVGMIKTYL